MILFCKLLCYIICIIAYTIYYWWKVICYEKNLHRIIEVYLRNLLEYCYFELN